LEKGGSSSPADQAAGTVMVTQRELG
jgi:transposase